MYRAEGVVVKAGDVTEFLGDGDTREWREWRFLRRGFLRVEEIAKHEREPEHEYGERTVSRVICMVHIPPIVSCVGG